MAEIKNKEKCKFHICAFIGAGRLNDGNARIVESSKGAYCIYPSMASIGDEDTMVDVLLMLQREIKKAKSVGKVYTAMTREQKVFVDKAINGARKISTWKDFLGRNAGFGSETHGDLINLWQVAERKRIDLWDCKFSFYEPKDNRLNIKNARIVMGMNGLPDFFCIYPSIRDVSDEQDLGRYLDGMDSIIRDPKKGKTYSDWDQKHQDILESIILKVKRLTPWGNYLLKPSDVGEKTNEKVMRDWRKNTRKR